MNNRIRLSKALILLILFLGVVVFGVLSCANTLPTQQEISVYIYDENKGEWVDYDIQNGTGKIVAFPGTRFARSITPHEFDVETESYYKKYSFNGTTYSLSNKLGEQVPFYGTFNASQKPVLYAFYEERVIEKHPVELQGEIELTKYVNIPNDYNGSKEYNPSLIVKLNYNYTFKTDELSEGSPIPSSWTLTKIKGINYIQGKVSEDRKSLPIYLSGTPYSSQEEVNIIEFKLPSRYVNDPNGVIDSFGVLPGNTETWTRIKINQAPFSAKNIHVAMESYAQLDTTIQIKADSVPVLRDKVSTIQTATAEFDPDVLKPGTVVVDEKGESPLGWTITPKVIGITYSVDSLNAYNNVLTLRLSGIPNGNEKNTEDLKITMPENVILGSSKAVTADDQIEVNTTGSYVERSGMTVEVEDTFINDTSLRARVKAIKGIEIKETSAEEVRIKITSGATFNRDIIEIGSEIPIDTTEDERETSKWKFPTRDGLKYTFGALSSDGKTLTVKIYGTLKDASPYVASEGDIEIPYTYFNSSASSSTSTEERSPEDSRIVVDYAEQIEWNYGSVSATITKDGGDVRNAIKGVKNVIFNSGDGANVQIALDNANFKAGITGVQIAAWFSDFEKSLNSEGTFTYSSTAGANESTPSPYILVNIKGASLLDTDVDVTSININIPYTDIVGATREFGSITSPLYYENGTLSLSLGEDYYGWNGNPLNSRRNEELVSGVDEKGQDIIGQIIQFNLQNGKFSDEINDNEKLTRWFEPLSSNFGKDLRYTYTSLSEERDKFSVKVTGVPTSTDKSGEVDIKLPYSAIKGGVATLGDVVVRVYYGSSEIIAYLVPGSNLYGADTDSGGQPISGVRYAPLSSNEGTFQRIRIHLRGGKFISGLSDANVEKWFASWNGNGISSAKYVVDGLSTDRTSVDVKVSGALTVVPSNDPESYSKFVIKIPYTDIENADFTSSLSVSLTYHTTSGIEAHAELSNGMAEINGLRYISLGDAGIDLNVRLENGTFNETYINDKNNNKNVIATWFKNWVDIERPEYTIKEISSKLITINIKGALTSPVNNHKTFKLVITKESVNGDLPEDLPCSEPIEYMTTDIVSAMFDNQNNAKYYGSVDNPIEGVKLAPINSGNGVLVKINLTTSKGTLDGVNGPRFVSGLNNDVSRWFDLCADYIKNASYTIEEGGKGKNYAVVRIKGGLTEIGERTLSVSIPASDIEGFIPNAVSVTNGLAYRVTDEITANVSSSSVYWGSESKPVVGTNGVAINNGDGYPIRIVLTGSVFSSSLSVGKDVASWFNAFTDLSESDIKITEIDASRSAITILVKGVLTKDTNDKERTFINIPPDVIDGYLTTNIQVPLYYQIANNISASFVSSNGNYVGTPSNPFTTIKYISKTNEMKVELKGGAVFGDISSSSIENWFKAFSDKVAGAKYEFIGGGSGKNYANIRVTAALIDGSQTNESVQLSIPSSDIKDAYLTTDVPLVLSYRISDVVSAVVSEGSENNYGSIYRPFTGTRYIEVKSGDGEQSGKLINIQLKNAKFVSNLSDNIATWFKGWTTFTNAEFSIAGGGKGENFITIRAKGILTDEVSTESKRVDIEIDKNAIDGYLIEDLKTPLYYKTTAEVEAEVVSGVNYYGSSDHAIEGVYGIPLNDKQGRIVRIELKNGAKFDDDVTVGADVTHWFSSLQRVQVDNEEGHIVAVVQEGGVGQDYVEVLIKGAFNATVSQTPQTYPIDIIASGNTKKDENDNKIYYKDGIKGSLPNAVITYLYFHNIEEVKAQFVSHTSEGSVSDYYGSKDNPLDGVSYVLLSDNNSGNVGLYATIKLANNVKFKNAQSNSKYHPNPNIPSEDVATWFKNWTDAAIVSGTEKFYIINGGAGYDYITIRVEGALKISSRDTLMTYVNISPDAIDGYLPDVVKVEFYYKASKSVSVSLDSGSEYFGSASYPIAEKNNVKFNSGNGILLRLNFENGLVDDTKYNKSEDVKDVKDWFDSMISKDGSYGLNAESTFTIERISDDKKSIIIRVKGSLNTPSIKGVASEVVVPKDVIKGYLPNDLTTVAYYCKTNDVTAYVSTSEGFYGSSGNPIQGTRYVNLTDARGNKGQEVKITLNGGKFKSPTEVDWQNAVNGWFAGLTPYMPSAIYTPVVINPSDITVRVEGALISAPINSDGSYAPDSTFDVDILAGQIDSYASSDKDEIVAPVELSFKISNIVGATIGTDTDGKRGTEDNPITGIKYVPLNNGDGVKIRISLENANFNHTPDSDELENTWFKAFNTLIESTSEEISADYRKYKVIAGGEGENYVDIMINGVLTVDPLTNGSSYSVNVEIPKDAINWSSPTNVGLTVPLYYNTTGTVSAKLDEGGLYRGANASKAITGIRYIPMNNKQGYEVKINLENAKFKKNLETTQIKSWFNGFTDLVNKNDDQRVIVRSLPTERNYVVVNIQGSLRCEVKNDQSTDRSIDIIIPKDAIEAELLEDVRLKLYYGTIGNVNAYVNADGSEFYGNETSPIKGVQYLPLGDSGEGVQVRIVLENATFKGLTSRMDVSSWFTNFKELAYDEGTTNFTLVDGSDGSNVVVVQIKGGLTSLASVKKTINIQIPKENIDGDFENPLDVELHYETTGTISAELAPEYNGTSSLPITGIKYIDIANGNGTTIKINLVGGAKFKSELTKEYIDNMFTNFKRVLIAPNEDESGNVNMFTKVSGGKTGDDYVTIAIKGALTSVDTSTLSVKVDMPAEFGGTKYIDAYLPNNAPVSFDLYYQTNSRVTAEFESGENYYYGAKDNPIVGVRFIKLSSSKGNKMQAYLKLGDGVKFSNNLGENNGARVKAWFSNWTNIEDVDYTIDGGGAGANYVIIGISGALTLQTTSSDPERPTATIYSLQIPPADIVGAHVDRNVEPIIAELHYMADKIVDISIGEGTKDGKTCVGSKANSLKVIQNVEVGSGDGEIIKLKATHAEFAHENTTSYWTGKINTMFAKVTAEFSGLSFAFYEMSSDYTELFIKVTGFDSNGIDDKDPSYTIDQELPLVINNEMIYNASTGLKEHFVSSPPSFRLLNPFEEYIQVKLKDNTLGTINTQIQTSPNTILKTETGQGVELEIEVTNAKFKDGISAVSISSWFADLSKKLGNDLSYSYIGRDGYGPGTNKIIVNVSGQTTATENGSVSAVIPGSSFIAGATPSFRKSFEVPIYYEVK